MAKLKQLKQMWETIDPKEDVFIEKARSEYDHEHLELRDGYGNKFEVKFYPEYYKEDK